MNNFRGKKTKKNKTKNKEKSRTSKVHDDALFYIQTNEYILFYIIFSNG